MLEELNWTHDYPIITFIIITFVYISAVILSFAIHYNHIITNFSISILTLISTLFWSTITYLSHESVRRMCRLLCGKCLNKYANQDNRLPYKSYDYCRCDAYDS